MVVELMRSLFRIFKELNNSSPAEIAQVSDQKKIARVYNPPNINNRKHRGYLNSLPAIASTSTIPHVKKTELATSILPVCVTLEAVYLGWVRFAMQTLSGVSTFTAELFALKTCLRICHACSLLSSSSWGQFPLMVCGETDIWDDNYPHQLEVK